VPAELVQQQHLVDVVAGQPVGGGDHDQVELGQRRVITQAVQAWSAQAGAAVAVIAVDMLLVQHPAVLGDRRAQPVKLLLDGLRLGLTGSRDPRIDRHGIRHLPGDRRRPGQVASLGPAHQQLIGLIPPAVAVATRAELAADVPGPAMGRSWPAGRHQLGEPIVANGAAGATRSSPSAHAVCSRTYRL
jgi:hypothetical protein